jgi:AcrR family transcriptional regulator
MRFPNEKRRQRILETADKLIRRRPYHEVLIKDVAAAASVSKGAIYIYFKNKEELFLSVIQNSFATLPDFFKSQLEALPPEASSRIRLELLIRELVYHASTYIPLLDIMRSLPGFEDRMRDWIHEKMEEVSAMIASIIRCGNAAGEFDDQAPEITAHLITAFAAAYTISRTTIDKDVWVRHAQRFVMSAISRRTESL